MPEEIAPIEVAPPDAVASAVTPDRRSGSPINDKRRRRWLWSTLAALAIVVVTGAAFVLLHKQSAPRAVRLLPESDAIVYVNVAAVRVATHFDRKPVTPDADYQAFVDATGIQAESDLDEAAFAVHRLANPLTAQGPFAYSEVFVGHFNQKRLANYLASQAVAPSGSTETYLGHTIYSVPHDGRVVRVAILGRRTIAVSNTPTAEQMHSILDHDKLFYYSGPTLLQDHFRDVPVFSFAWGLGQIEAPLTGDGNVHLFGFRIPLPTNTVFVASARYIDALHLRVEEIAPDATVANVSATMARTVLSFYSGEQRLRSAVGGTPDADMAELLRSVQIEQKDNRAILTATVPLELLHRIFEAEKQ
jgi:hypothetical protein